MGCCQSTDAAGTISNAPTSTANPAAQGASGKPAGTTAKEDQIALAFKAKRANVFSESVDVDTRRAFSARNIPKTPKQEQIIREFKSIFVFNQFC